MFCLRRLVPLRLEKPSSGIRRTVTVHRQIEREGGREREREKERERGGGRERGGERERERE